MTADRFAPFPRRKELAGAAMAAAAGGSLAAVDATWGIVGIGTWLFVVGLSFLVLSVRQFRRASALCHKATAINDRTKVMLTRIEEMTSEHDDWAGLADIASRCPQNRPEGTCPPAPPMAPCVLCPIDEGEVPN